MARNLLTSSKSVCLFLSKNVLKPTNAAGSPSLRFLYAKATLGLDTFAQQKHQIKNQMANISEKFREKMGQYVEDDSKNMIFTEDLKNMLHLAENDDDIELAVNMMKKFNQQNKQMRFGTFVFGPVAMRLFHLHNKADLALECFRSAAFTGFFDQLISYQILMDLLYENSKYNEMLETFEIIKDRQVEDAKFPKNIIVLTMAACYKLNSKESLEYALKVWRELAEAGHFPMRRGATFCAGLALNQGQPSIAMEILSSVKNPNYTTVRNIKVAALADVGRVDDAIPILKGIISEDSPTDIPHTFNRDVLDRVKAAILKSDNADLTLEFNRLEKLFEKQGHISNMTLDEQLCCEIQKPPMMNNRQTNRFSRYEQPRDREGYNRYTGYRVRPGLKDIV